MSNITTLEDAPNAAVTNIEGKPLDVAAEQLVRHNEDLSGERSILTIHAEPGAGTEGQHAVFVGLNGVGYNVPRSKPVNVPVELVHNLDNAQIRHYGRSDKGEITVQDAPRFAYSVRPAAPVGKAKAKLDAAAPASAKSAAGGKGAAGGAGASK